MNTHTVDLTGGIDSQRELAFASRPENPEMRDSASFWVFDDQGHVGLPRVGIEALASHWEARASTGPRGRSTGQTVDRP
jgi:hypothetical protein